MKYFFNFWRVKNLFVNNSLFFYVVLFINFLFYSNIWAQEQLLPISQIRDIGARESIKKELEDLGVKNKDIIDLEKKVSKDGSRLGVSREIEYIPTFLNKKFDVNFQGYIAVEGMYDTRQVIGFKDNEYTLFPAPQLLDKTGLDINDKSQFNMLAIRATLTLNVKGPEIWGAQTSALIEGDFTGLADTTVGLFRLKKALARLEWENSVLTFGQYYHPICLDEIYPEVISFGRGIIYDPFKYAPQIKFRQKVDRFEFVFAISKRYDSEASRHAAMPDLYGQMNVGLGEHLFGAGINYHSEVPRLFSTGVNNFTQLNKTGATNSNNTYKTTQEVNSIYPFVFAVLHAHPLDIRMRATYAENGNAYSMIGGYDVLSRNERTDEKIYVNTRTMAFWTDIVYNRLSKLEPAVFMGVSKNLGTSKNIIKGYQEGLDMSITDPDFLTLLQIDNATSGIDYTFIFAPRLRIKFGELLMCAELEYTRASFAQPITTPGWENDFNCKGEVVCSTPVNNFRMLFATFYNFDYNPFTRA